MKPFYLLLVSCVMSCLMVTASVAQDSYRIRAGDTIRIEVLEDTSLNRDALVRPDGRISVPFAGSVAVGGQTIEQIRSNLASELAPNFASTPNVFVTLGALAPRRTRGPAVVRTIDVYMLGEAAAPGKFTVKRGTTLLQFFAEAGGMSRFAATKRIVLRRTNKAGHAKSYKFNYDAMLTGASAGGSTTLANGDVVIIPQRRLFE